MNMEKSNSNKLKSWTKIRSIHKAKKWILVLELTVPLYFIGGFRFSQETDSIHSFIDNLFLFIYFYFSLI